MQKVRKKWIFIQQRGILSSCYDALLIKALSRKNETKPEKNDYSSGGKNGITSTLSRDVTRQLFVVKKIHRTISEIIS